MGGGLPKQYRLLGGKPVVRRAAEALLDHPAIDTVRIVVGPGQLELAHAALHGLKLGELIQGGEQRADSVCAGLNAIDGDAVLIHDAVRPFCPPAVVDRLISRLKFYDGAAPVLPVSDTLAQAATDIEHPIDRTGLVRVQTPQAFQLNALRQAYTQWSGTAPTDETTVARAAGLRVAAVEGDQLLEKITTSEGWDRAETMLTSSLIARAGFGFDVHAFAGDGPIMLGGIAVPHSRGLSGHSDADVVLHAITDALLGAAALGDIGQHFPPSDPQWRGASSDRFLAHAANLIRHGDGIIDHIDCTVICEAPKIGPVREAMRLRIAEIANLDPSQVNIKATTTESLGFTGRGEGIAAQAVANIRMEMYHG